MNLKYYEVTIYDDKDNLVERVTIIGMEEMNLRYMKRITGGDPECKIRRLLDWSNRPRDIADPWFSGDFEAAWRDIGEGCAALLDALTGK